MKFTLPWPPPPEVTKFEICFSAVLALALVFFLPRELVENQNLDAVAFLIVGTVMTLCGFLNTRYRAANGRSVPGPFVIRAWGAFISGVVALPVAAIFRRETLPLAFVMLIFGAGAILGDFLCGKPAQAPQAGSPPR